MAIVDGRNVYITNKWMSEHMLYINQITIEYVNKKYITVVTPYNHQK